MTALVSFERVFEVLDLQPLVADRPGARDAAAGAAVGRAGRRQLRLPRRGRGVPRLARAGGGRRTGPPAARCCTASRCGSSPGQLLALVGPSGAGKTTITSLVARLYDATSGSVRVGGADVREVTQESLHARVGVVTQEAHLFHDTVRANLAYAKPGATEEEMVAGTAGRPDLGPRGVTARAARHRGRRPRAPALRRREAADRARPPAAQGTRGRRARRGDRAPRLRVASWRCSGPSTAPWRAGPRSSSRTGCRPSAPPTSSPSWRTAGWSSRAGTRSCWRAAACTPTSTGRSSSEDVPAPA